MIKRLLLLGLVAMLVPACTKEKTTIINNIISDDDPVPANGDGSLVTAFDGDGVVLSDYSPATDYFTCVAIDAAGQFIYLAGRDPLPGNWQWHIEKRSVADGSLVTAFDGDGIIEENLSGAVDSVTAIALDATFVYLAGEDGTAGGRWRIEKRNQSDGALVTAFDGDGAVIIDPTGGYEIPYTLAIDATGIYVGGLDFSPGNHQWRLEKRDLVTGAPVLAFDTDGIVQSNPGGGQDQLFSVAIAGSSIYLFGSETSVIGTRLECRSSTTGALDVNFDGDGSITIDPTGSEDIGRMVTVDPTGQFLFLLTEADIQGGPLSNSTWRIEKRTRTDGALHGLFGVGGTVTSNPTPANDTPLSLVTDGDFIYVIGTPVFGGWRIEKRTAFDGVLQPSFGGGTGFVSEPTGAIGGALALSPAGSTPPYLISAGGDTGGVNGQFRIEKRLR